MMRPSRRTVLQLAGAAALAPLLGGAAHLAGRRHGMSLFGDLKYPADFAAFDYVAADAPKGGRIVMQAPSWVWNQSPQTFNTLASFVDKGDAPPRLELTFDTLMAAAADESDSLYGLLAEEVALSADESEVRFFLRQAARFHDGTPVTADDVVFSLQTLKSKGHATLVIPLKGMLSAEAAGPREVAVRFAGDRSPALKLLVAGLPIFSRAYYSDKDFAAATMTPPLGSGPYRVGNLSPGHFIEYERVADYWGKDLPVRRGHDNFDVIRIEFFRDRTAAFEAFKKGAITFRQEFTSKSWATEYGFPAVAEGKVVRAEFPGEKEPDYQAWYFNTRRRQFADPRTRQALGLAFDFEWANANLFFGSYERSASYFQGSVYQAEGPPAAAELALLEPFRDRLPPEAFGPPPVPPVSDGSGRDRNLLRQASALLAEAGWTRQGGRLADAAGTALTVEFLIDEPVFERVLGKYVEALRAIGVGAAIRLVDPAQYQARQKAFDFDVIGSRFSLGATPLEGLTSFFTAEAADAPGSNNFAGIRHPAVDALVAAALAAKDREAHRIALSALDRVLRVGHYTVPQWRKGTHWVAMWDMFGRPPTKPDYAFPVERTWWFEAEKARRIGRPG